MFTFNTKFNSAQTHPPRDPAWVAHDERMIRYIFVHDRSCPDECISPDRNPAQNGRIGSQCGSSLDKRWSQLVHPWNLAPGIKDVRENHRWPAEDMIFERDTFIDRHIILDFDFIAHSNTGADDDILADFAVFPNARSFKDMRRVPNTGSLANLHSIIHKGRLVSEIGPVQLGGQRRVRGRGLQHLLALLEHGQDPEPFLTARSRLSSRFSGLTLLM